MQRISLLHYLIVTVANDSYFHLMMIEWSTHIFIIIICKWYNAYKIIKRIVLILGTHSTEYTVPTFICSMPSDKSAYWW